MSDAIIPSFKSRMAGFFWLMTIVTGMLAVTVYQKVAVSGDAAAVITSLRSHESLFRLGVTSDLLATMFYLGATLLVYELLRPVNRTVSRLAAVFSMMGCGVAAISFVFRLAPFAILSGGATSSAWTPQQLQALAFAVFRLRSTGSGISFAFFGLHCLLVGCLIVRSTFLPRLLGVLMLAAGTGWLIAGFSTLLSPPLARAIGELMMIPGIIGEGSLTLWLLVAGVNVQRWHEQALATAQL